jgi:enoyl-CoA hydratase
MGSGEAGFGLIGAAGMSEAELLTVVDGATLVVTFNRPKKRNTITPAMLEGLHAAFLRLKEEEALRVMLIRAAGEMFSSGFDIVSLKRPPTESGSDFRTAYRRNSYQWLWDEFEQVEKPIVVAHHGLCLGGALEMSLSCDFRLASSTAEYGLPELNLGFIAGSGGTSRLTRLVGPQWARWLVMANKRISAERALAIGLIQEIYPVAEFEQSVRDFCAHLAAQPREAMAAAKLAIELTRDLDRAQGRNVERLVNSALFGREEQQRLFAAMLARFDKKAD